MTVRRPGSSADQDGTLEAAFADHRRELLAHCYRLAGNVADAGDLVQETFLRAWRARASFEGRASIRTWLYRIATNVFLDRQKAAQRRILPVGDILEWSTTIGPYPDELCGDDVGSGVAAGEMVELALIAALMHLPSRQRAAFVLRDVNGWTPAEIADALDVAVPAANSLVQRARETIRRHAPADPQDWRRPTLTAADQAILRRYAAASGPEAIRLLLADDVRITMPPDAPVVGIDAVTEFLARPLDWRTVQASANGRPALVNYLRQPGSPHYEGLVVDVLHIVDGKIVEINAFVGPRHVAALGMPATWAQDPAAALVRPAAGRAKGAAAPDQLVAGRAKGAAAADQLVAGQREKQASDRRLDGYHSAMLVIRPVVTDDDYAAYRNVRMVIEPGVRIPTTAVLRSLERPGRWLLLAEVDGELAGCGYVDRSNAAGRAAVSPEVLPEFRRQGIGTALLRVCCELAEPLGFPTVGSLADEPGSVAFGERHGFVEVDRQVEQVRSIGVELWPTPPAGVEIVSVADRPELWEQAYDAIGVPGYADMAASREVTVSREQWLEAEINEPAATFLALRDGQLIGTASLLLDEDNPARAEHGLTAVVRAERGKGVAAALKRQTLAWAAANGIVEVYTWTQQNNENMRRLNERLGFTYGTVSVTLEAQLPLPQAAGGAGAAR